MSHRPTSRECRQSLTKVCTIDSNAGRENRDSIAGTQILTKNRIISYVDTLTATYIQHEVKEICRLELLLVSAVAVCFITSQRQTACPPDLWYGGGCLHTVWQDVEVKNASTFPITCIDRMRCSATTSTRPHKEKCKVGVV